MESSVPKQPSDESLLQAQAVVDEFKKLSYREKEIVLAIAFALDAAFEEGLKAAEETETLRKILRRPRKEKQTDFIYPE